MLLKIFFLFPLSVLVYNKHALAEPSTSFILLGASGDLAKRSIYPALWALYRDNSILPNTRIFGFARTAHTIQYIRSNCDPYVTVKSSEKQRYEEFWKLNYFINGTDGGEQDYATIDQFVANFENGQKSNRIFYMAIPPDVFVTASANIKKKAIAKRGYTRIAIEKPFARDSDSAKELEGLIGKLYSEDQIYRVDGFLGLDMVRNLMLQRFGNRMLMPWWNKDHVASVEIDFAELIGIEGRGDFFDKNGVIRDIFQNHLLQLLSVIAMDEPSSAGPDDIKAAKVKLLKSIKPIVIDDVVLGQYISNPNSKNSKQKIGYRDEPTVPDDSIVATFATTILRIDNKQWKGVPFIIRCGKGLDGNRNQAIIQLKNVTKNLFGVPLKRNEFVVKFSWPEALEAKIVAKVPGYSNDVEEIFMGLNVEKLHPEIQIPEQNEILLRDLFAGLQANFVRDAEISEAWRIFTPIIREIEDKKIRPFEYLYGSSGPPQADELERKNNFLR